MPLRAELTFIMEKRVRRRRMFRVFVFWFSAGLLLSVVRHALSEVEVIRRLLFD